MKTFKLSVNVIAFTSSYPHACAGDVVIASVRLSVMLSPPKPLDRIQPNLVSGLLTQVEHARARLFLAPPPGALGRGQKVKYYIALGFAMACHRLPDLVFVYSQPVYRNRSIYCLIVLDWVKVDRFPFRNVVIIDTDTAAVT